MFEKNQGLRVKVVRFGGGERCPAVVDANGMLVHDPNVYAMLRLRSQECASNTMEAHLRAIVIACNWAASRDIDLRERVASLELLSSAEMFDLRDSLRENRRDGGVVASATYYNRCHFVRDYLAWLARAAIQRISVADPKLQEARQRLEWFERAMVAGLPKGGSPGREGVDENVQAAFREAITPGSPTNPFQAQHQHRNQALLHLYWETGMRRGEALKIKGEHLIGLPGPTPVLRVLRDPDAADDARRTQPAVKTLPRDLEISPYLGNLLYDWVVKHRTDGKRYPGAKRTPYVFVSRSGQPLALRTVNDMFELLRERVPGMPDDFSPHILRHTSNDRFSEASDAQGLNEAEEKQARNYVMGWTKTSNQGDRYTRRHTRKRAAEVMQRMQDASVKGQNR